MQLDTRVYEIERYLDRNFAEAFIFSSPPRLEQEPATAHTFRIEENDEVHTLKICHEFLESYSGSLATYLDRNHVADILRQVGSDRVFLTADGLRKGCDCDEPGEKIEAPTPPKNAPLTDAEKDKFIDALSAYGNVSWAVEQVGRSRACLYLHRDGDPEFRRRWDDARRRVGSRYNRVSVRRGFRSGERRRAPALVN